MNQLVHLIEFIRLIYYMSIK